MSENENRFDGYDWTELSVEWGLIPKERKVYSGEENEKLLEETREKIRNSIGLEPDEKVVNDCDEYIRAILEYEEIDYYSPLWKALREIREQNENSFLKAFASLLGHAWT